jgi:hypothetical protein
MNHSIMKRLNNGIFKKILNTNMLNVGIVQIVFQ